jgi:hypothetical protein
VVKIFSRNAVKLLPPFAVVAKSTKYIASELLLPIIAVVKRTKPQIFGPIGVAIVAVVEAVETGGHLAAALVVRALPPNPSRRFFGRLQRD